MKLIEILVRDLPSIGGWPERAISITQDDEGYFNQRKENEVSWDGVTMVKSYYECPVADYKTNIAEDMSTAIITREQYEAALAASKTEWDGEGLPPVGLPVELQYWNDGKVEIVRVIAYHGNEAWVEFTDDCRNMLIGNPQFRPIRSEADKKRDESMRQLSHSLRAYGSVTEEQLSRLYNDIEAGFIPHIRID